MTVTLTISRFYFQIYPLTLSIFMFLPSYFQFQWYFFIEKTDFLDYYDMGIVKLSAYLEIVVGFRRF